MAKRPKLDEEEVAKLMRLIVRVRAGASLGEIAETLNAMGIATPRGGRWNARSVAKALERVQEARNEPE